MRDAVSLIEATLWLWPETVQGEADLANPIWVGAAVNQLRMERVPVAVETRPTGAPTPRRHVLTYLHTIGIGHVLVSENDRLPAPLPVGRMVLQVTWVPEEWAGRTRNAWMRRVFRGVTVDADQEGDREGVGFDRETRFQAEFMDESGGVGAPPLG